MAGQTQSKTPGCGGNVFGRVSGLIAAVILTCARPIASVVGLVHDNKIGLYAVGEITAPDV